MKFLPTSIPEVLLIEPLVRRDQRGWFTEVWHEARYREAGISLPFVQDNHSRSARGTLRGLHFQQTPHAQGKLVRVAAGEVFDVAVDLRCSSPTFRRFVAVRLSAENQRQLWIPPGFAHGFYVTSDSADLLYKCTAYHSPEHDRSVRWDDAELGIAWPLEEAGAPILSPRDAAAPPLREAPFYP